MFKRVFVHIFSIGFLKNVGVLLCGLFVFSGCSSEKNFLNELNANLSSINGNRSTVSGVFGTVSNELLCLVKNWNEHGRVRIEGHDYSALDNLGVDISALPKYQKMQDTNNRYLFKVRKKALKHTILVLNLESGFVRVSPETRYGCFHGQRIIQIENHSEAGYKTIRIVEG